jgi:hypothetical protein
LLLEECGKNTIWNICDNTRVWKKIPSGICVTTQKSLKKIPYGISVPTQETCYSSII